MRSKRSLLWNHFDDMGNDKAQCKICEIIISYKASISNLAKHMSRKHFKIDLKPRHRPPSDVESEVTIIAQDDNGDSLVIAQPQRVMPKRSVVWNHFDEINNDKARCKICEKEISYKNSVSNLAKHLSRKHFKIEFIQIPSDSAALETAVAAISSDENIETVVIAEPQKLPPRKSSAWKHFDDLGNYKARCKVCEMSISYKSSVSNLIKHVNRKHFVAKQDTSFAFEMDVAEVAQSGNADSDVESELRVNSSASNSQQKNFTATSRRKGQRTVRPIKNSTSPLRRDDEIKKDIDRHIMNLFIYDLQQFSIIEDMGFRKLIKFAFPNYTMPSRKFFSTSLLSGLYEATKAEVMELLNSEMLSISVSTYMWTSRNSHWFLAFTGHFLDSNMVLRSVLLECCVLNGTSHSATVLAAELTRIVAEWNIKDKILVAISDNDTNINCAIKRCLGWKHFNCYAHCLNLVISNALENNLISKIIQKAKDVAPHFQKNTVAGEKLKGYLEQISKPLKKSVQEFPTRWISIFYMLEQLLKLKEELNIEILDIDFDVPVLSVTDWNLIEKLVLLLKPCEEAIKEISNDKDVTGSSVIPVTIALKSALVAFVLGCEPLPDEVETIRQDIFNELVSQLTSLESNRLFTTCMFLDPRYKLYFENEETAESTKKYVIGLVTSLISEKNEDETLNSSVHSESSVWSHYYKKIKNIRPCGTAYSRAEMEIQRYIDDDVLPKNKSPLKWWNDNKNAYPHLAILARENLNALATIVPCERLISAGNILSDRRTRLDTLKIQKMLFLQQNLKNE